MYFLSLYLTVSHLLSHSLVQILYNKLHLPQPAGSSGKRMGVRGRHIPYVRQKVTPSCFLTLPLSLSLTLSSFFLSAFICSSCCYLAGSSGFLQCILSDPLLSLAEQINGKRPPPDALSQPPAAIVDHGMADAGHPAKEALGLSAAVCGIDSGTAKRGIAFYLYVMVSLCCLRKVSLSISSFC